MLNYISGKSRIWMKHLNEEEYSHWYTDTDYFTDTQPQTFLNIIRKVSFDWHSSNHRSLSHMPACTRKDNEASVCQSALAVLQSVLHVNILLSQNLLFVFWCSHKCMLMNYITMRNRCMKVVSNSSSSWETPITAISNKTLNYFLQSIIRQVLNSYLKLF